MIFTAQVVDADSVAVENVGVQLYDVTNTTLIDTQYTDATGTATFDEPAARYQLRFCGEHVLAEVDSPRQINVKTPPPANAWQFVATTFTAPVSPNPNMCRCWGFFVDAAGQPLPNVYLRLIPQQDPAAVYLTVGYAQKPIELITDENGYFVTDLIRGGLFSVMLSGYLDSSVDIEIPAQGSCNIIDILFPAPDTVTYVPPGPLGLAVGATTTVAPSVLMSDGRTLTGITDPTGGTFVDFSSSDESIMTVESSGSDLILTGVAPGAATIVATTIITTYLHRVPAVVLTVTPVNVVVV